MTAWTIEQARGAARQPDAALPVIRADDVTTVVPGHDVWDMWQLMRPDGSTAIVDGRQWWFFLATPRFDDPEHRHDAARIRLVSLDADGWRDHGDAFPDGFAPGSREWSGSAVLDDDGAVTMYFTAAGRRGEPVTFEQRLFETSGRFADGRLGGWSEPTESVVADGATYRVADQAAPIDGRIKGFRDPCWFRDPVDGAEYLLFVGSAGWVDEVDDGVVGVAVRDDGGEWRLRSPLATAIGVNSELERPHVIVRDGRYYLFWSTQAKRFAGGIAAPTGLYGMVGSSMAGPFVPLNGTGLVAANPSEEPFQAYCWWVTGELDVISFVDYWGMAAADPASSAALRRDRFGGAAAPWFSLTLDGDRARVRR